LFQQSPLTTDGCSPQGSQGSQGTPSQSPSVLSPVSINSRTPPTRFSFTSSPPPDSPNQTTLVTCDIVLPVSFLQKISSQIDLMSFSFSVL